MEINNNIAKTLITLMDGLLRYKPVFLNDIHVFDVTAPYIKHGDVLYIKEDNTAESDHLTVVQVKDYIFELIRWIAEAPVRYQLEALVQLSSFITRNEIVKIPDDLYGSTLVFMGSDYDQRLNHTDLIIEHFPSFTMESEEDEFKNSFEWWLEICASHRTENSGKKGSKGCRFYMYHFRKLIKFFDLVDVKGYELDTLVELAKEYDIEPMYAEQAFALVASKVFFDSIEKHEPSTREMNAMIDLFITLFDRYDLTGKTRDGKDDMSNALSAFNDTKHGIGIKTNVLIDNNLANISSMVVKYKEREWGLVRLLKA